MLRQHKVVTRIYVIKTFSECPQKLLPQKHGLHHNQNGSKLIQDKIILPCQLNKNNLFTDHEEKHEGPFLFK